MLGPENSGRLDLSYPFKPETETGGFPVATGDRNRCLAILLEGHTVRGVTDGGLEIAREREDDQLVARVAGKVVLRQRGPINAICRLRATGADRQYTSSRPPGRSRSVSSSRLQPSTPTFGRPHRALAVDGGTRPFMRSMIASLP
jgi:hypothetical protein